jgi:peptidoglycan/LPS O-acetylase OafA/YrhL
MNYRREIDGLRAVAVLAVILFHAGFEKIPGGFVGVDVFFVISGYLITGIILEELERGDFSLAKFYDRRARRILPALFVVMTFCIPFAWLCLLPSDRKDFCESLLAVSIFASNILFWRESGYFDTAAELKPLLHTWSLAVEEQYYVIFPLVLMGFRKIGKRWLLVFIGIALFSSIVLAQWQRMQSRSLLFIFYQPVVGSYLLELLLDFI